MDSLVIGSLLSKGLGWGAFATAPQRGVLFTVAVNALNRYGPGLINVKTTTHALYALAVGVEPKEVR